MELKLKSLNEKEKWTKSGFKLPQFDIDTVRKNTIENPTWVHFGPGNIFRAFLANIQQEILNKGKDQKGIIAVCNDSIKTIYDAHDNLTALVTLKVDGSVEKTLIGSIAETILVNATNMEGWERIKEIFTNSSLQMVSFTITEKGYGIKDSKGNYHPNVLEDFKNGWKEPISFMGQVASLLVERFKNGGIPIAMVSMDNMSHNGDKLQGVIFEYANKWLENGLVEKEFIDYISDPNKVSFPWSMIDKITPRPDDSVRKMLKEVGFKNVEDMVTENGSYVSPFVNAEESEYLVIEEKFPNGRPSLEEAGVIFTDRETVDKVEKMKVCTCLNPLHTALAIYGCLLGYRLISKEMEDKDLRRLVEKIAYEEGFPVVVDPKILDPKMFLDEVINVRFPNPFIPDTPQRIATDTSQKLGIRFGETIKAYNKRDDLNVEDLKAIPLVLAGWLRYLMAIDDEGMEFDLSPDPLLDEILPYIKDKNLKPILSNSSIFGVDLYEIGLGERIEQYFEELIKGKGAVRKTLKKYIY